MAKAVKFDRCGKYCDGVITKVVRTYDDYITGSWDFCDECMEDLRKFADGATPKSLAERLLSTLGLSKEE